MRALDIPFNIELLRLDQQKLGLLKPVTRMDAFETVGGNLAEDGLFSISIFGRVGEEARDLRFSYIDLKTTIFHPVIYQRLHRMKSLYTGIMSGKEYAVWDAAEKDFVRSNEMDGQTGYAFFMQHWNQIEFKRNESAIRNLTVDLFNKYRNRATVDKIMVLPAGLRDIETDSSGRIREGEINEFYRRILAIAATISQTSDHGQSPILNSARFMLQTAFNNIFEFLENMLQGKKGFLQGKWGSRRVFNGTRNVITTMNTSVKKIGGINAPKFTDTIVGLHQLSRAILPVTIHLMRNGYLSKIFSSGDASAYLIDPKSLKRELVKLPHDVYDRYTTVEGIEKVIASYGEVRLRHKPVMVEDRYVALIYADDKNNFKVFYDIDELPEGFDRKWVRPLTLCELLYLSGYQSWNKYAGFVTRYPVTGTRSCYPTTIYVKTTIVGEIRYELGENWERIDDEHVAIEFPVYEPLAFLDSLVIPPQRLAGLGADFDGDTCSLTCVYSDEAVKEIIDHLHSKMAWVDPRGWLRASVSVSTLELVLRNMTGDPKTQNVSNESIDNGQMEEEPSTNYRPGFGAFGFDPTAFNF